MTSQLIVSAARLRAAVRQVLGGHEPYPAAAVDRAWNIVEANRSVGLFLDGVAPELLEPPINALRVSLHPHGLAPRIVNLGEWRAHLLGRLRRQLAITADAQLAELYAELEAYPCQPAEPQPDPLHASTEVVMPLRVRRTDAPGELTFFSIVASFGTPLDITVDELAIESFFPADQDTAAALHALAGR